MYSLLPNSKGINSFSDMDTTVEVIKKDLTALSN